MLYAKVVFGLPVEGPFDYIVPQALYKKIKAGARVIVQFGARKKLGYVVKLSAKTNVSNLKSIQQLLDEKPVLNRNLLLLTKKLSEYYCCAFGEAIETALPEGLRRGKAVTLKASSQNGKKKDNPKSILLHSSDNKLKWEEYLGKIKETLNNDKSVIVLLPDKVSVLAAEKIIKPNFGVPITLLYRKEPQELGKWVEIKEGRVKIVIGTRSAVFAPLNNLGLIIIDKEEAYGYKQDQVPHYNARQAAIMRAGIDKATLILGSSSPSLESMHLARKNKLVYKFIPQGRGFPEIKIGDARDSRLLQDSIIQALNDRGKILLFLNRLGFATVTKCPGCGTVLKCRRCNINLVFHYKENTLSCHYCNFKMEPPKICPNCNSSYIRYLGAGTEKMESELARLFPQARVKRLDKQAEVNLDEAEIFISTQSIIKETGLNFDLIAVLSIDNSLNYADFRAAEKAFEILVGLTGLTEKKILIQTNLGNHHVFRALLNKDAGLFYDEELRQRRELSFPPYSHIAFVKLRGKNENRVEEVSKFLFGKLNKLRGKPVEFISVNPGYPSKLRGNFYWQLVVKAKSAVKMSGFLKTHLTNFPHSGIIVTVDVDPL